MFIKLRIKFSNVPNVAKIEVISAAKIVEFMRSFLLFVQMPISIVCNLLYHLLMLYLMEWGGNMPVFVKYANSQYEDRFLNPQGMHWFSRGRSSFKSSEIAWMTQGQGDADWAEAHFIPLFVMRKADAERLKMYYYVGRVGSCANMRETTRDNSGETVRLVEMDLRLTKPLSAELYQHLTGDDDE